MKLRIISLLLVMALALIMLPATASAAGSDAQAIQKQIESTYRTAQWRSGKSSFNGYCGSLVNWQTYILGIDQSKYGCDGKNEFDLYSQLGMTTGGYRVESYPASRYTLREALNAITKNGTIDAYNILVGFQRTNTQQGSIYGHALLIHGIIDGVVYFMECYSTSLGGQYWPEGSAISCSIDTFCDYYNRWTVFDGIAYFGLKTYADACEVYPADMYAMAKEKLTVYEEPFDAQYSQAEKLEKSYIPGQMVRVTNLLKTPEGKFFYQIEFDGQTGYVIADKLACAVFCESQVELSGLKVPTALYRGYGFWLRGTASAGNSSLSGIYVAVYSAGENGKEMLAFSGALRASGNSISLSDSRLDNAMTFRSLASGKHRLVITATVENYILSEGVPTAQTSEKEIWNSEFLITTNWNKTCVVTFDGNGGDPLLDQRVLAAGEEVGELPGGERAGYVLTGWSLDPEGTKLVTDQTVFEDNVTLYAQWEQSQEQTIPQGWHKGNDSWHYHDYKGRFLDGMFIYEGLTFLQNEKGELQTGWQKVGDFIHYFNEAGAMVIGWQHSFTIPEYEEAPPVAEDGLQDIVEEVMPEPPKDFAGAIWIAIAATLFCSGAVAWILIQRKNKVKEIPLT